MPATYAPAWYWNTEVLLAFIAGVIGATPVMPALAQRLARASDERDQHTGLAGSMAAIVALLTIFSASLMLSAARSYNPFIYFRF